MEENFYPHLLLCLVRINNVICTLVILCLLGFLGPVTNIRSTIDNCTNISIYWDSPTLDDDRVSILYYNLSIYDDINNQLVKSVSVYGTIYQFKDTDVFRHRYTYVVTGVNELGEGISNRDTFSYQRGILPVNKLQSIYFNIVPRSVEENTVSIGLTFKDSLTIVHFNIPVRAIAKRRLKKT